MNRAELMAMMNKVRSGDMIVAWKLDRLGRSLRDLIYKIEEINAKGASFYSIKDQINTNTPTGKFLFNIMAYLSEFERDIIRERTMAGMAAAKIKGKNPGRPKGISMNSIDKAKIIYDLYETDKGYSMAKISQSMDLPIATCYRYYYRYSEMIKKETIVPTKSINNQ